MNRQVLASAAVIALLATSVAEARREPRRFYRPVRFLTEARVDEAFHVGPFPPTRDEQLRPLPSFYAPPGSPGSNGRGVHNDIWNRVRHFDWQHQQLAQAPEPVVVPSGPRVIDLVHRNAPTTRPSASDQPIIASIRIR